MAMNINASYIQGGGGGRIPSGTTELMFDDDDMANMAEYFVNHTSALQDGVDSYVQILHDIRTYAIIEGDTAKALDSFISYADKLKDIIKESGESAKKTCENFVTTVDSKDASFY